MGEQCIGIVLASADSVRVVGAVLATDALGGAYLLLASIGLLPAVVFVAGLVYFRRRSRHAFWYCFRDIGPWVFMYYSAVAISFACLMLGVASDLFSNALIGLYLLAIVLAAMLYTRMETVYDRCCRQPCCSQCGYLFRHGMPDRCPECGTVPDRKEREH